MVIALHLNAHLAMGTVVAVVATRLVPVPLSPVELAACILASCVVDADFVFTRVARDRNHRMLPTHSLLVPCACWLLAAIVAFTSLQHASIAWMLVACGANILVHLLVDSIDWGLNLFLRGRLVGLKLLLGARTSAEFHELASKVTPPITMFYHVYFHDRRILAIEGASACAMILSLLLAWDVAAVHWWVPVTYVALLALHAGGYARHAGQLAGGSPHGA